MTRENMNNKVTVNNAEKAISAATRGEQDFTVYAHKVSPVFHRHTETILGKTRKYSNKAYKQRNEMLKAGAVSGTAGVIIGMLAPMAVKGAAKGLNKINPFKKKHKVDNDVDLDDDDFDLDEEIDEEEDDD